MVSMRIDDSIDKRMKQHDWAGGFIYGVFYRITGVFLNPMSASKDPHHWLPDAPYSIDNKQSANGRKSKKNNPLNE